jgi:hypothetical protein
LALEAQLALLDGAEVGWEVGVGAVKVRDGVYLVFEEGDEEESGGEEEVGAPLSLCTTRTAVN